VTLILNLDLGITKLYLHTKNQVCRSRHSKVCVTSTYNPRGGMTVKRQTRMLMNHWPQRPIRIMSSEEEKDLDLDLIILTYELDFRLILSVRLVLVVVVEREWTGRKLHLNFGFF